MFGAGAKDKAPGPDPAEADLVRIRITKPRGLFIRQRNGTLPEGAIVEVPPEDAENFFFTRTAVLADNPAKTPTPLQIERERLRRRGVAAPAPKSEELEERIARLESQAATPAGTPPPRRK
jgi:hypothetical protein